MGVFSPHLSREQRPTPAALVPTKYNYDKLLYQFWGLIYIQPEDWKSLFPQGVLWDHCHRDKEGPLLDHPLPYRLQPKPP